MYGAIIGDIIGSIYEYNQTKQIKGIKPEKLFTSDSFYSDDTILTIAILDAILTDRNYELKLKEYGKKYMDDKPNFKPYFSKMFSPGFIKWVNGDFNGKSIGNGAMMRISPVGYMFDNFDDIITNTKLATIPSHNSIEAIKCASIISLIIFYLRKGYAKDEILDKLNIKLKDKKIEKFNSTCYDTIDICLLSFFNSNSFEEAIRNVLLYGGDTDTNACIVGSLAEAYYGIDDELINEANMRIPKEFVKILEKGYNRKK